MCGGRGLPLPLAMLGEIQLTLPIAARSPAPRPGRRACRTPRRGLGRPFLRVISGDIRGLTGAGYPPGDITALSALDNSGFTRLPNDKLPSGWVGKILSPRSSGGCIGPREPA